MTHPLTDAICYDIALKSGAWNTGFSNDDLRTAYDKGVADSSTAPTITTGEIMTDAQ